MGRPIGQFLEKIISLNCEVKETVTRPVADKADLITQYLECLTGIGKFEGQYTTAAETYGPHMGCIWATYGDLVCNIWSFFNIWGRKSFRKHNIWATYGSLFQTYGVLLKHIGPF